MVLAVMVRFAAAVVIPVPSIRRVPVTVRVLVAPAPMLRVPKVIVNVAAFKVAVLPATATIVLPVLIVRLLKVWLAAVPLICFVPALELVKETVPELGVKVPPLLVQ